MIKINKGDITTFGNVNETVAEILTGVYVIKRELLSRNNEYTKYFDKSLQRIVNCKSLEELEEEFPNDD